MNYRMFLEQITKTVQKHTDQRAQIHISRIQKVNMPPVEGMTILLPGENAAPAIYLDSFYQEYLLGIDLDTIAEEILAFHRNNRKEGTFDLSFYMNFDLARKNIVCRLINYETNKALLKNIPHKRFLDLAIVYYYRMDNPTFGKSSILVQNAHISLWGIGQEQLHTMALHNTKTLLPFRLGTMEQFLRGTSQEDFLSHTEEDCPSIYILTNNDLCFGAVNIIFEDILEQVRETTGSDFYVLPSSIHECLILPTPSNDHPAPETLREIVTDINEKYVDSEEVLGNHVYRYTRTAHSLRLEV